MNLRNILNRLTEEELELLQEEIEGDLYEEIDKVIDDKRQPSLFCQGVKVGDVYICDCYPRGKAVFRIKRNANPDFIVEALWVDSYGVYYSNHSGYKAGEMLKWRKVGNENWELLKESYEKWLKDVERIKDESVKYYGEIWDKLNNEGK